MCSSDLNSTDSSDRIENLANFMQRYLQFPQSDNGKLIQYLNAYDAPRCEQSLNSIRSDGVVRKQVQKYAGVKQ